MWSRRVASRAAGGDIAFVIDLLLNFITASFNDTVHGTELDFNPLHIARDYLKSWFVIDLISSVPFDLFVVATTSVRAISIVKCVRLLRLNRLFKKLDELGSADFVRTVIVRARAMTRSARLASDALVSCSRES